MISLLFFKRVIAVLFALIACIISLITNHGGLRFDRPYLRLIMYDSKFHTIGYLYLTLMLGRHNVILYVPLLMTAFLESSDFIIHKLNEYSANFPTV